MFFFAPYKVLIGKPEGKRRLGRPRRRGEDNIKTQLKESGWESLEWFHRAQDRGKWRAVVTIVMRLRVPQNAGNQ
jgi:hypothetical protein